jgi:hypothetical protein
VPIPGPIYDKVVVRGQQAALAEYPTLSKPYPWVKTVDRKPTDAPIVGYIGHRQQMRQVFSQSTFLPVNPRAAVVTDPWQTSYGTNFPGHRDEVARLAKSRSQGVLDRYETMRTLSASASTLGGTSSFRH